MTAPLAGRRIVNTRAAHQAAALNDLIRERGAIPVVYPCISIVPPEDTRPLNDAISVLLAGGYDWLVLTSGNVVLTLRESLNANTLPADTRIAAVGPSTAEAAESLLDLTVDLIPDEFVAESLAETMKAYSGARVLLPQSNIARPVLADSLGAAGLNVTQVAAYRTITGSGGKDLPMMLAAGEIDALTFTSPSTVRGFVERLAKEGGSLELTEPLCTAAIGPVTEKAARKSGLHVNVVPGQYTLAGMIDGIERYYLGLEQGWD